MLLVMEGFGKVQLLQQLADGGYVLQFGASYSAVDACEQNALYLHNQLLLASHLKHSGDPCPPQLARAGVDAIVHT